MASPHVEDDEDDDGADTVELLFFFS